MTVAPGGLGSWFDCFRVVQAAAIWANHGAWITAEKPALGPGIRERFEWARALPAAEIATARARLGAIRARLAAIVGGGGVVCLPSSPRVAPLKNLPVDEIEIRYRHQAMHLLCIAGLGGLPQISLPMGERDGLPIGLSLIGPYGGDEQLLALARDLLPGAP